MLESPFNKVEEIENYLKETSTQVFFYEICEISENTYFEKYMRTTASVVSFSWLSVHFVRHGFINQKYNAKTGVHIFTKIKYKDRWK